MERPRVRKGNNMKLHEALKKKKALEHENELGAGAAKRREVYGKKGGQPKVGVVMHEFKKGTLHSGGGGIVKNRRQAIAIAMSEAGLSKR